MSGTVNLTGSLTATPSTAGSFPTGITNVALGLNPATGKPYTNATGDMQVNVATVTYETMQGIGVGGVAAANVFYLRASAPLQVRLTLADASQPVIFADVVFVSAQTGKEITKVEVIGSGTVEYFAAGNS